MGHSEKAREGTCAIDGTDRVVGTRRVPLRSLAELSHRLDWKELGVRLLYTRDCAPFKRPGTAGFCFAIA